MALKTKQGDCFSPCTQPKLFDGGETLRFWDMDCKAAKKKKKKKGFGAL
jgi:hypothetical protein